MTHIEEAAIPLRLAHPGVYYVETRIEGGDGSVWTMRTGHDSYSEAQAEAKRRGGSRITHFRDGCYTPYR